MDTRLSNCYTKISFREMIRFKHMQITMTIDENELAPS